MPEASLVTRANISISTIMLLCCFCICSFGFLCICFLYFAAAFISPWRQKQIMRWALYQNKIWFKICFSYLWSSHFWIFFQMRQHKAMVLVGKKWEPRNTVLALFLGQHSEKYSTFLKSFEKSRKIFGKNSWVFLEQLPNWPLWIGWDLHNCTPSTVLTDRKFEKSNVKVNQFQSKVKVN